MSPCSLEFCCSPLPTRPHRRGPAGVDVLGSGSRPREARCQCASILLEVVPPMGLRRVLPLVACSPQVWVAAFCGWGWACCPHPKWRWGSAGAVAPEILVVIGLGVRRHPDGRVGRFQPQETPTHFKKYICLSKYFPTLIFCL